MKFGTIEYLNLAPFDVFIKSYPTTSSFKKTLQLRKSYPAKLNKEFLFKRIDAGFISSIAGHKCFLDSKFCNAGIISKGAVWSVLVKKEGNGFDQESATSNALLRVLNLEGRVIIGDKALRYYQGARLDIDYKDMGLEWYKRTGLPFIFGEMCFNNHGDFYNKMIDAFNKKLGRCRDGKFKGLKIPHYIIMEYIDKVGVKKELALKYLQRIYYHICPREKAALKRFYRALRLKQIKGPKRF